MLQSTSFWVLIGFLLFVAVAGRKIWAAIADLLDKHAATIAAQLKESATLRSEAEAMMAKAKADAASATAEADAIITQARHAAEEMTRTATADLEATLGRRQKAALDKIAQAEAAALAEVRAVAVDVAITATAKLLTQKAQGPLAGQMIDSAIADLPARLN